MHQSLSRAFAAFFLAISVLIAPVEARPARFPPPGQELMVPVTGGRVYVRVNGDLRNGRPPLVLIHGGPGGTHAGLLDALALSDQRAVILFDQLDSGLSDHPANPVNWTVKAFVDELETIRAALGVTRWYVLGGSWGGTVALEYAARRPAALAGVVLASPLISTNSWLTDANVLRASLPAEVRGTLIRCDSRTPPPKTRCDAATASFMSAFNRREPLPAARLAAANPADKGFNEVLYNRMWGASEFVSTGTLRTYDGEPLLARLDGRHTLFIVGQYDEARPATALRFAARVKGAEVAVIPGAAHSIFNDRPDETNAVLRAWFERQDRASR